MSDTHCSNCSTRLLGGGGWCCGCGTYMHIKCSACQLKTIPIQSSFADNAVNLETHPEPCDFWKNFQNEQIETLRKVYKEIIHRKPIFFTSSKNKVGFKIADVMNIILTKTLEDGPQTECAMTCTMIMPHLLLARSKCAKDASITKTLSRRLDL